MIEETVEMNNDAEGRDQFDLSLPKWTIVKLNTTYFSFSLAYKRRKNKQSRNQSFPGII